MKRKDQRSRRVTVRFTPEEYEMLQTKFRQTTHRFFSDYTRDLIQQKPITVRCRNQSLDDFLPVAIALKNELQAIGRNINQAVRKLNNLPPQAGLSESLEFFAAEELALRQKTDEIKQNLVKIYELWSQK